MAPHVDAWVQVACPRLSVDWGHFFDRPVLTSYELEVAMGGQEWRVRVVSGSVGVGLGMVGGGCVCVYTVWVGLGDVGVDVLTYDHPPNNTGIVSYGLLQFFRGPVGEHAPGRQRQAGAALI